MEDLDDDGRVVMRLSLRGVAAVYVKDDKGKPVVVDLLRASATGDLTAAEQLGRDLAAELLDLGAGVLSAPEGRS